SCGYVAESGKAATERATDQSEPDEPAGGVGAGSGAVGGDQHPGSLDERDAFSVPLQEHLVESSCQRIGHPQLTVAIGHPVDVPSQDGIESDVKPELFGGKPPGVLPERAMTRTSKAPFELAL